MIPKFIPEENLTRLELKRLNRLRSAYSKLVEEQNYPVINFYVRDGDHMASSDGKTYISINRRILTYNISYFTIISALNIIHEISHYRQTTEEKEADETHTRKFYKTFHNICFEDLSEIIYQISKAR